MLGASLTLTSIAPVLIATTASDRPAKGGTAGEDALSVAESVTLPSFALDD